MIHFKLKNINEIYKSETISDLNWYFLSDGDLWLTFGDTKLYEYSQEALEFLGQQKKSPYNDYFLIRFVLDFTALFSKISKSIPKKFYELASDLPVFLSENNKWLSLFESAESNYQEAKYEDYLQLNSWVDERTMDSGHLIGGPRFSFFRYDTKIKIVWQTDHILDNGIALWTAKNGHFEMDYFEFVNKTKDFLNLFFIGMEKQVNAAIDLSIDNVKINKIELKEHHIQFKKSAYEALIILEANSKEKVNWEYTEQLYKKMKFEIEKSFIWKVLEDAAPATFPPYANLEDKQFSAISHQELFRLRKIE